MKFDTTTEVVNEEEALYYKTKLDGMLSELFEETGETIHDMQEATLEFPDPADRANYEFERNTTLRIRDRERKLAKKIRQALQRLEDRAYNECEDCGEEIGKNRLDARPVTTYCIDCKQVQEQKENTRQG